MVYPFHFGIKHTGETSANQRGRRRPTAGERKSHRNVSSLRGAERRRAARPRWAALGRRRAPGGTPRPLRGFLLALLPDQRLVDVGDDAYGREQHRDTLRAQPGRAALLGDNAGPRGATGGQCGTPWCNWRTMRDPMGAIGGPHGCNWGTMGDPMRAIGCHCVPLGDPMGANGGPHRCHWVPSGDPMGAFGCHCMPLSDPMGATGCQWRTLWVPLYATG